MLKIMEIKPVATNPNPSPPPGKDIDWRVEHGGSFVAVIRARTAFAAAQKGAVHLQMNASDAFAAVSAQDLEVKPAFTPNLEGVSYLITLAAQVQGVSVMEIMRSRVHTMNVVAARHAAMYLARQLTGASMPELAKRFRCDHTTIVHAEKRYKESKRVQVCVAKMRKVLP